MSRWLTILVGALPAFAPAATVTFEDVTAALGIENPGSERAAWVDYNNDGWPDLMSYQLWRNEGGTRFVEAPHGGGGPAWADFDNDGYLDFFRPRAKTVGYGSETGEFTIVPLDAGPSGTSDGGTCLDINGDGFVDLYWGGYEAWGRVDAYPDAIFTNTGDRRFTCDWQSETPHPARGITAADYDNDGDTDIYVSNYRLRGNILWRNNGAGTFEFASTECGVLAGHGHSIGAAWGDIDNDGHIDLFAGNFAHGGQPQSQFLRNLGPDSGYTFDNLGTCGVHYQESYASPALGDYDNDGDLDLFFTTVYGHNAAVLYRNDTTAREWVFTNVTEAAGLDGIRNSGQAAWGDFDNDGDLDLMAGGRLYRNSGTANRWLKVKLVGDTGPDARVSRAAIGAVARVKLGDRILTRSVESATGWGNMNDLTLHFGLGTHTGDVPLEVSWPHVKTRQQATAWHNCIVTVPFEVDDDDTAAPAAAGDHEKNFTMPGIGMAFVWIDALDGWVGTYEVTNSEYRQFYPNHTCRNFKGHDLTGDRLPVVNVSHDDASAYAQSLTAREAAAGRLPEGYTYRLPTGEEWSSFARCGDNRRYPWGDTWPPAYGNYDDDTDFLACQVAEYVDGHAVTCPVEESGENEWGVFGVGGNAWEWTDEWHSAKQAYRVLRGASWVSSYLPRYLECDERDYGRPSYRGVDIGFRLVLGR